MNVLDPALREYKKALLKKLGWSIFIVECVDGSYVGGMTRNMKKELIYINVFRKGTHFCNHPERVPVKVVYQETSVPWKEAIAKYHYLREMTKRLRKKLIDTKKWPYGGTWRKFLEDNPGYVQC